MSRHQLEAGTLRRVLTQLLDSAAEDRLQNRTKPNATDQGVSVTFLEGRSRKLDPQLVKHRFVHSHRFSVLPSFKAPRWLLPLGDTNQMLIGSRIYAPYAPSSRLLKALFLGAIKAGWQGWGCPRLLVTSKNQFPLEVMVREITGEPQPTFAMSVGLGGKFRKLTVQVMRRNGEILGYIKFPLTDAAIDRVQHETAVLERLSSFAALRRHIPKVLYANKWADGFLLFQSAGPRLQGPLGFGQPHEAFLRRLWRVHQVKKPGRVLVEEVTGRWQRLMPQMDGALAELGKKALDRVSRGLDGMMLPCGVVHGDFAPWNTRVEGEDLFVFDWESAAWDAPILWDKLHFHVQVNSLLKKNSGRKILPDPARTNSASFLLYLLSSACQYLEEGGTRHPGIEYRRQALLHELS